ncbi:MAG: LysM peptidoglycan-binding domain-containing protein [Phycisphaerales bacterium]|nr:LysM peptidoglycan-binding domain-containing protein [Phycisphaerales bacterium]
MNPLTRKEAIVTRESKLALIIGFVLVLVVGVLVSDHFSQANSMTLDIQESQRLAITQAPITNLGIRSVPNGENQLNAGSIESNSNQNSPVVIQNGRSTQVGSSDANNSLIDRAFNEAKRRIQDTDLPQAAKIKDATLPDTTTNRDGSSIAPRRPLVQPNTNYPTYKVVAGDSLIAIARKQLGNSERWKEIHELNADRIGPNAILKVGMTIKLPIHTSNSNRSIQTNRPVAAAEFYVVKPGDTLGEISMKLLGTSKRASEFVSLNNLDNANDIRVGMKLKVPN